MEEDFPTRFSATFVQFFPFWRSTRMDRETDALPKLALTVNLFFTATTAGALIVSFAPAFFLLAGFFALDDFFFAAACLLALCDDDPLSPAPASLERGGAAMTGSVTSPALSAMTMLVSTAVSTVRHDFLGKATFSPDY